MYGVLFYRTSKSIENRHLLDPYFTFGSILRYPSMKELQSSPFGSPDSGLKVTLIKPLSLAGTTLKK